VLVSQVEKSFLAFNRGRDTSGHYGAPLLDFAGAILLVFGVAYAFYRIKETRFVFLLLWLVLVLVFGGVMTVGPPVAPRLLLAIPVVCILVALGAVRLSELGARLFQRPANL